MQVHGRVFRYGKDVNTDLIIPARYLNIIDVKEQATHTMEDLDPEFPRKVRPGDIVVAEENYGCGSSREEAPLMLKTCGVSAVVAKSFARIFFRNAINIGLPVFESAAAVDAAQAGDELEIDTASGLIRNLTKGQTYQAAPLPEFIQGIIRAGGLVEYVRARVGAK
ncbi:MAG: 3-isopropylmalate dehydratase small subunit [Chloroflexi bacterium]|nr:3-isopropylmalate dehydratase small subunit [Chloroflexota bacterium]